jgi:hypothetical protein
MCFICRSKNTESVVAAGNVEGLEVNADKTKYLILSRRQNIKIYNSSIERVEEFKYLGKQCIMCIYVHI